MAFDTLRTESFIKAQSCSKETNPCSGDRKPTLRGFLEPGRKTREEPGELVSHKAVADGLLPPSTELPSSQEELGSVAKGWAAVSP
jgi:hypothetical protein